MGLLKTILIIALVYYGIKILSRIFAPLLLKFAAKKAEERFGGQFGQFQKRQNQQSQKKEGEITIDKIPETKTSNKNVGEYVDYEEIE
ncbi:DUF4834 family protein [Algibacter amylolyticus]|uniref:DUF4834 family protein n=1 Tax=Algibacter amylolyticus TaxID=1608400 RepID=A0A5M7BBA3_9FLAO|nr:DUF4834 family protein [Algibacter amylolyticus]KAA5825628.1 DUF4834 family protein [Algibacter amylolyticus]MBB5268143.1 hypothetical protein [Algibacter amylolyticus]TSJ79926.1 DUF4834 family protein [Algibacter amylolyticus]